MTLQDFVDWGRRIADGYAAASSRLDPFQRAHEFDGDAQASDEFLNKSNEVARAFTVPGGPEKLSQVPALLQARVGSEENFIQIYQALGSVLQEILEGMWIGEWVFNDSGLIGMLKIDSRSQAVYIDSQGESHETIVTTNDEEFGMSYESLHLELKYFHPAWKIHAYIFRWNRLKMAGIVEHGETEGRHSFYAVKREVAARIPIP